MKKFRGQVGKVTRGQGVVRGRDAVAPYDSYDVGVG